MFTGIITDVGKVKSFDKEGAVWKMVLLTRYDESQIDLGASICCNGVCLTVVDKGHYELTFQLSKETVEVTNYKNTRSEDNINLEKSLKIGDELGGHYVSGHVDGVAEVSKIEKEEGNWVVEFKTPKNLAKYIAKKGSVTLNGVSLTVNFVKDSNFGVNVIPHTLKNTNLGEIETGKTVNLEVDIFARYIDRINQFK